MKESKNTKIPSKSALTLFPTHEVTVNSYCVIKNGPTLAVNQCRRITIFGTKEECKHYQSRLDGFSSQIISIQELTEMAADKLKSTLGLQIPTAFDQGTRILDEDLLQKALAERPSIGINTACGDVGGLIEVANELGVMFAGLPLDSDTVEKDIEWRRPQFGDAGAPCEFAPEFWNSPNPRFVFEGIYIPAPGCYTVGEWLYINEEDYQPTAEVAADSTVVTSKAEVNEDNADEKKNADEESDLDEEDYGNHDYEPAEMKNLTLEQIQTEVTVGEDLPFNDSWLDDIRVQAVCRFTPRTQTMITILKELDLASKDG